MRGRRRLESAYYTPTTKVSTGGYHDVYEGFKNIS